MAVPNLANFERRRSGINTRSASNLATNAYGRFVSQQRGQRGITDATQNFKRQFPRFSATFGRRGLAGGGLQSGVQQRALRNYVGDHNTNLQRLNADQEYTLRNYDLNAANFEAERQRALADLEAERAQALALTAQQLTALKPFLEY